MGPDHDGGPRDAVASTSRCRAGLPRAARGDRFGPRPRRHRAGLLSRSDPGHGSAPRPRACALGRSGRGRLRSGVLRGVDRHGLAGRRVCGALRGRDRQPLRRAGRSACHHPHRLQGRRRRGPGGRLLSVCRDAAGYDGRGSDRGPDAGVCAVRLSRRAPQDREPGLAARHPRFRPTRAGIVLQRKLRVLRERQPLPSARRSPHRHRVWRGPLRWRRMDRAPRSYGRGSGKGANRRRAPGSELRRPGPSATPIPAT